MPFVPLAFVNALLLVILLANVVRRDGAATANHPFIALLTACAIQSVLLGLRWGYGLEPVRYGLPIGAAVLPPLVYLSFETLASGPKPWSAMLPHLAPSLAVLLLVALWRPLIDVALIAIYVFYATALLRLASRGADALSQARLDAVPSALRSLHLAGVALFGSALVDALIALDLGVSQSVHAAALVSIANLAGLLGLGIAASVAGRSQPAPEPVESPGSRIAATSTDDPAVLARIDDLMSKQGLYRNDALNLDRLARKAGIPARQISAAINRETGRNVSQYVNDFRIADACRLLRATDLPLTQIMFEVGFQTKSNFNREFRRVTGTSPTLWRAGIGSVQTAASFVDAPYSTPP